MDHGQRQVRKQRSEIDQVCHLQAPRVHIHSHDLIPLSLVSSTSLSASKELLLTPSLVGCLPSCNAKLLLPSLVSSTWPALARASAHS